MKIALIGYGKMGKEIEKIALSRGHEIVSSAISELIGKILLRRLSVRPMWPLNLRLLQWLTATVWRRSRMA